MLWSASWSNRPLRAEPGQAGISPASVDRLLALGVVANSSPPFCVRHASPDPLRAEALSLSIRYPVNSFSRSGEVDLEGCPDCSRSMGAYAAVVEFACQRHLRALHSSFSIMSCIRVRLTSLSDDQIFLAAFKLCSKG
jgi:hypothetical protein